MGLRTAVRVLDASRSARRAVAEALEIAPGEPVIRACGCSTEAGLVHITTYVPLAVAAFTREDLERQPLLMLLESAGVEFGGATQTISARLADAQVAPHLDVAVGSALLAVTRLVRDVKERPCSCCRACTGPIATNISCNSRASAASTPRSGSAKSCRPNSIDPTPEIRHEYAPSFPDPIRRCGIAARAPVRVRRENRRAASGDGRAGLFGPAMPAGALLAIEDINQAGGIKSLGGAPLEAVLGDAPEAGSAEVEKMAAAGVSAVVGAYASAICLATTQTAARHGLPHVVDVGVADQIVERGLKNTFRFGPGYRSRARHPGPGGAEPGRRQAGAHGHDRARGLAVRRGHGGAAVQVAARARLRGERGHQAPEPDARFQQHRAAHALGQSGHRDSGQLLQRIRAAAAP